MAGHYGWPAWLGIVDRCAARTPLIVTCGGPFGYATTTATTM
jgi:hypothetical protein